MSRGATATREPVQARRPAGVELAANARLAASPDFAEGVACVVGARRGEAPAWSNAADACPASALAVDASASFADVLAGLD